MWPNNIPAKNLHSENIFGSGKIKGHLTNFRLKCCYQWTLRQVSFLIGKSNYMAFFFWDQTDSHTRETDLHWMACRGATCIYIKGGKGSSDPKILTNKIPPEIMEMKFTDWKPSIPTLKF